MDYERMWKKLKARVDDSWDDSAWVFENMMTEVEEEEDD